MTNWTLQDLEKKGLKYTDTGKLKQGDATKFRIPVEPLSVNAVWKGRRFKTDAYRDYEILCNSILPPIKIGKPPYKVSYVFGMSNKLSDFDNPVKPITDILQKRYGFNDRDIMEANIKKVLTKKGEEFIEFEILSI